MHRFVSRRAFLAAFLGAGFFAVRARSGARAQVAPLTPTPSCDRRTRPTRPQAQGPYFRPRSPRRNNLVSPNRPGERVSLAGYVLTRGCRPVEGAVVELWHADARGQYDTEGSDLRGHVLTDALGRWSFETIVPGAYSGRTRHYHIKAQAPGGWRALTTQLYFPGEAANTRDSLFDQALVMQVQRFPDGRIAVFNIVLDMA
jgi:protocatechuate 3,4-dioxygenase beta subunit